MQAGAVAGSDVWCDPGSAKQRFARATRCIAPGNGSAPRSHLSFDQLQLQFGDGFGRVETLRAGFGAVHDGVAAVEPERVFEIVEPLAGRFVTRVFHPARRLQQRGGAEEAFAVPPVARARGRAARAQDALVEAVEL